MMRLRTYGGLSLVATMAVIYHAFKSRGQFYPAMVYLSTSKVSLVLLLNTGFAVMCSLWNLTKRIFLGTLREAEVERLNEQLWREVMEILFAITIFRQDFSVMVVAMVAALLFVKALHWLAQKRVEYTETTPSVTMLSHVRIVSFLGFLLLLDTLFLYNSAKVLVETRQPSVSLFFSFEYMILVTTTVSTFVKYVFYVSDMLMEGQWERKAVYTFYLELIRDLLHLSMYLCFFLVIFMNYGVPLHLIRELYETFRNFRIRIADYIRYRKITSNMDDRFPNATPEELDASDATCIICREEMTTAKKLICGHLFHVHCLRSWLERQHTCPTCRALVIPSEGGASAPGGQQGLRPDAHRQGTSPASTAADNSSGGVASNGVSQHHARLQAAAAAAALYGKSFVYPSANTAAWSPGYAFLPPSQRPPTDSTNMESGRDHTFFGQPGAEFAVHTGSSSMQFPRCFMGPFEATSNLTSRASLGSLSDSDLEAQIRFIQQQIEVLQFQLQHLQKSKAEEDIPAGTSASSGSKGKAPVTSSTSDCGCHTGIEDGDDHKL